MSVNILSEVTPESLVSGPLKFSFPLGPQASIETTVTGEARNIATVGIFSGSMPLWSHTLTQVAPEATVPYPLTIGNLTIEGAKFYLQIPTTQQQGFVQFQGTLKTPTNPEGQPFSAPVAQWPLTSA